MYDDSNANPAVSRIIKRDDQTGFWYPNNRVSPPIVRARYESRFELFYRDYTVPSIYQSEMALKCEINSSTDWENTGKLHFGWTRFINEIRMVRSRRSQKPFRYEATLWFDTLINTQNTNIWLRARVIIHL